MKKIIIILLFSFFLLTCKEKKANVALSNIETVKLEDYIPPNNYLTPYLILSQPLKDSLLEIFYEEVILNGRENQELLFFQKLKTERGKDKYWDTLLTYCEQYNPSVRENTSIERRKSYHFAFSLIYKFPYKYQNLWIVTGNFTCDMHKCNELHLFKSSTKGIIKHLGFVDNIGKVDSVFYNKNKPPMFYYFDHDGVKIELSFYDKSNKYKTKVIKRSEKR